MSVAKHPWGTTDWQVPVIGQGTWRMEEEEPQEAIRALQRGVELGLTHVDTAEIYGDGAVEGMVAEAIAGRRDKVFLVSKVTPTHASYEGTQRACEGSLRRLKTDHLDSYLLHWRGPEPLEETVRAFEKLVQDGKVRSWGLSNFELNDLEAVLAIAGEGRIACNQVLYHLGERSIGQRVLPWCEQHRVSLVAYSTYGPEHLPAPASPAGRVFAEVARVHRATPYQVALAFLTHRPSQLAVPRARSLSQVGENAKAARFRLSDREAVRLADALAHGEAWALPPP